MATVRPDGTPHVMPFVFALDRTEPDAVRLYWAVDDKPKRSGSLQRVENIRTHPAVEVVIDGYDEDWATLWWVRIRGNGRVVASDEERRVALEALASKYAQYRTAEPRGDVVAIDVDGVTSWSASQA
jgi:PPOX class probable F420-dependent enzyme